MKFLIDAQLPYRLKDWIASNGHDAIHTRDLPDKNKTKDRQIIELAEQDSRIIVTKDSDYIKHYILFQKPSKLIMITTGNLVTDVTQKQQFDVIAKEYTQLLVQAFQY